MAKSAVALKRLLVGRPMSSGEMEHTLLPKTIALPVFASDPLSSNAYATQEILVVLGAAGVGALTNVFPISIAVGLLLITVVTSYRQTVRAYPNGGGAYRVARENLGMYPGLLAGAALLLDYIMTVAVSITAGADAIVSAAPQFADSRVPIVLVFIAFVAFMNLRGVRESGVFFAVPTYGFVLSIYALLITGFLRCFGADGCPQAESAGATLHVSHELTLFLILKAFSAGTTALTGVEAIADGVQAFRYPQSKNAAKTLAIMGGLSVSMFLGISWLADHTNVIFEHGAERTVVAQIAHAVFGGGAMFYVLQTMTAAILILAANTAYADFPRLASILAQDRFMPHQFRNRGDRLVFSNGIIILSGIAAILVVFFDADLNRLIQLYLVGVFISFTLSQSGMVMRHRKIRERGWKRKALLNGFGATVTGTVLVITTVTKFAGGAWMIIVAIPLLMLMMRSVYRHYSHVKEELGHPGRVPEQRRLGEQNVVIYVARVDAATARALGLARSIRPRNLSAVTFDPAVGAAWKRLAPEVPLTVLPRGGTRSQRIRNELQRLRGDLAPNDFLTFMVPETLRSRSILELVRGIRLHMTKARLRHAQNVQVLDVPVVLEDVDPNIDEAQEPARNYALVLVSGVHNATLQAIEYAETLRPTDLRGVHFGLDPEEAEKLGDDWLEARIPHPLEIEDSPFRDIGISLHNYIKQIQPDGVNRVVTVVIPEFIVRNRRHEILHNQTALIVVKRKLLFEKGVVLASVPFHL